jgi:hypothetical protein
MARFNPGGEGQVHDLWAIGRTFTLAAPHAHHGAMEWITWVPHTGAALDEPGAGAFYRDVWRPTRMAMRISSRHVVDLANWGTGGFHEPFVVEIEIGGPMIDDSALSPYTAWSGASFVYFADNPVGAGDFVSNGGADYRCMKDHTSGVSTEPGVGSDWQRMWVLVTGKDAAICDAIEIYAYGGVDGRNPYTA